MPVYKVAGHDVDFPHKAYGVQLLFMDRLLKSLDGRSNGLLEAPTGCGKTLALLCGALAWQTKHKQGFDDTADEIAIRELNMFEEESDFEGTQDGARIANGGDTKSHISGDTDKGPSSLKDALSAAEGSDQPRKAKTVPKIYYATRTHSQIAQVIKELKTTAYRPSTAVLGSKSHYCIHKEVTGGTVSIEEGCEALMESDNGCPYKHGVNRLIQAVSSSTLLKVHDIEDLVKAGSRKKACPYFTARSLAVDADVVFCPYNYLVDPVVRASMDINLRNCVVIFDEAHNIEDVAREAASVDVTLSQLQQAAVDIAPAAAGGDLAHLYLPLQAGINRLIKWLESTAEDGSTMRNAGFEELEAVWSGGQIRHQLARAGLDPATVNDINEHYKQIKLAEQQANEQQSRGGTTENNFKQGRFALGIWHRVLTVLLLMYKRCEQGNYPNESSDYRLVARKWMERRRGAAEQPTGRYDLRHRNHADACARQG